MVLPVSLSNINTMLLFSIALIVGLVLLVMSSDKFIEHSALVAEKLNVNPMIIGITLVAFGTSAPEMVVSAIAALDNAPEIAVGNVLGSNIANIALVSGITLLFSAIPIASGLSTKEVPLVLAITLLAGFLLYDQTLGVWDGVILIAAFIIILTILLRGSKDLEKDLKEGLPEDDGTSVSKSLIIALIGLAVLIGSSKLLVWGAIGIATALGVSELVIGLTIVAVGTSLPELAASISSVRKGHHDIAIGNILGSNIFNLATVLPLPALIAPGLVDQSVISRDFPWVLGLTVALALAIFIFKKTKNNSIPRWVGLPLIASYGVYLFIISSNGSV
ncbi:MAG: calcium/sodium antiporter [Gammaproteobacteria bacterium]|nr:calcium/sodium antiporter [Gammaproteobacteria bacterium]MBU1466008.1 calcium/sodium antiporter [Gammaproteobacteria bacterium]MBU2021435.1 calcium/sodium antiporter [Gammaproteobacteria bacterium]MBU2239606.1 calcium/sodium antiporter [Gammaproteobacteria bacterium]MBU2317655.1 calcium/sodium antiporter [Gammaproteobacteria bacterium]